MFGKLRDEEKMKTFSKISAILVTLMVVATLSTVAFAATTVDTNWNTSGFLEIDVDTGDAFTKFQTNAGASIGNFFAKDYDNNPYGYGVDSYLTNVKVNFVNGYSVVNTTRTNSWVPMYGPADQSIELGLMATGTAQLAWQTTDNYAEQDSSNYGHQANDQMLAEGTYDAYVNAVNGPNFAGLVAGGVGSLNLDLMTVDMGSAKINFGAGCGCYTNADVTQTGPGLFGVQGIFTNSLVNSNVNVSGSGTYSEQYSFSDGFSWDKFNFSLD